MDRVTRKLSPEPPWPDPSWHVATVSVCHSSQNLSFLLFFAASLSATLSEAIYEVPPSARMGAVGPVMTNKQFVKANAAVHRLLVTRESRGFHAAMHGRRKIFRAARSPVEAF
jgi:hypothetical protein